MEAQDDAPTPSERFEFERRLGAGGFGSVSVVLDRVRDQRVALKRLDRLDPASIYRFKQEFRALSDVVHPNLVRLHELFHQPAGWSFTMEWVDGVPFDEWVRAPGANRGSQSQQSTRSDRPAANEPETASVITDPGRAPTQSNTLFDERKLRDSLRQLSQGVAALHTEGILHRDLKPSNVLIDGSGRVVILDFGMVATGVVDSHESVDGATVGTPAYMSPEQARGAPLTVASDWYAVGLMLYEVLSGHLPFGGTVADILTAKASRSPRDPSLDRPWLPKDLVELCLQLLQRDPSTRPSGHEVLRRLDAEMPSTLGVRQALLGAFIGRERERQRLKDAFTASRRGQTVVALVHGPSGHGKSTLIRHFLSDIALHDEVVVLDGRCYERETVPFKALDDLVDALYRYLRRLRPVEAATFMPRHAQALVRLFPTLGRLDFMSTRGGKPAPTDPHELRRRAFNALREMFARLTDMRPVVLFIDDVQWGDADSAALFQDLLAPPDVPPLLLIVGYRGDGADDNELLQTLRSPRAADASWETVDIALGPLLSTDAESLARHMLGEFLNAEALARAIAEESGGSPLFVAELARRVRAGKEGGVSLQRVVAERVLSLPPDVRTVIELLACSERPLSPTELEECSGQDTQTVMIGLDRLREEHLVDVSTTRDRAAFEILHDKMRLVVRESLDSERLRTWHGRLATILEKSQDVDPETLAYHFAEAGDLQNAQRWTEIAADRALDGVAFDHAVMLHRRALAKAASGGKPRLLAKLAAALANAGRGEESAQVYLEASKALEGDEARSFRQAAAEQYLRAGMVEQALEAFGPLLAEAGLALPSTPTQALVSLLWKRLRLKWRGYGFEERDPKQIDAAALRAIDFCWSVGTGLAGIDLVRSARYYVMSLHMSLKFGDRYRIARSLSIEAIMKALESTEGVKLATSLADQALEIATRINDDHALGWATAGQAVVAWGNSDLARCRHLSNQAIAYLRKRSLVNFREIGSMEVWFGLNCVFLMGDLKEVAERAPAIAREAQARGDRYTFSTTSTYILPYLWAARDLPEQGRKEAEAAMAVWPEGTWYHQHWAWLRAMCFLDLYEGHGAQVLRRTDRHSGSMRRAMQLRVRTLRSELQYLQGRGAIEMLVLGERDSRHDRGIRDSIEKLESEDNGLSSAYARLLRAGLSAQVEKMDLAAEAFRIASSTFTDLCMPMHAAASDWRRGECLAQTGDTARGEPLIRSSKDRLAEHGVKHPERFARMLVPRIRVT